MGRVNNFLMFEQAKFWVLSGNFLLPMKASLNWNLWSKKRSGTCPMGTENRRCYQMAFFQNESESWGRRVITSCRKCQFCRAKKDKTGREGTFYGISSFSAFETNPQAEEAAVACVQKRLLLLLLLFLVKAAPETRRRAIFPGLRPLQLSCACALTFSEVRPHSASWTQCG